MPSAIASDTGKASQAGSSARPPPAPPVPKVSATAIAASAITDSIERSICPAISVSDRPTAMMPTKVDCSRMLRKMPICKNFGMNGREARQRDQQDDPDQIVEHEGRAAAGGGPVRSGPRRASGAAPATRCRLGRHSTDFTGSVGGFRLPQNFGSSTFSLVIAAPGILMFGPQLSMVSSDGRPITS